MLKVLVPVDGSDNALRAVEYVVAQSALLKAPPSIHLVNVQLALVGVNVKIFIAKDDLNDYYRDEGRAALARACERLDAAGVTYQQHIGVGDPGEVIAQYLTSTACDHVVMGRRGLGSMTELMLGSVTNKVIHLAKVPVVLVR